MAQVNGFFGFIKQNHTRSIFMFAGFAVSIQLAFSVLLSSAYPVLTIADMFLTLPFNPETLSDVPIIFDDPVGYVTVVSPYVFGLSIILFVLFYHAHTKLAKIATGFRHIHAGENVRLYNMVQYLAITAGIEPPSLGVIDTAALNSFACGRNESNATIVVTQGLLNELNDDELRAVIAHEIVHIVNGDIQLMAMANASQGLIKLVNWLNPVQMRNGKNAKWLLLFIPIFLPIIVILSLVGFVMKLSNMIASMSRYFISSSREYIADAEAVRLTHNPAALISALSKIEGRSTFNSLDPMIDAMMIDGRVDGEFASHPPIQERVQALVKFSGSMVHGVAKFTDTRSFGTRHTPSAYTQQVAQTAYREKAKKSLFERINVGSSTNVFNIPKKATLPILIGLGLIFSFTVSMQNTMSSLPGYISEDDRREVVAPIIEYSPAFLALSLNGPAIHTQRLSSSKTYFPMTAGGHAHRTGWLKSGDGFLFLDKNNNGKMDGISELMTSPSGMTITSSKIFPLSILDTNNDGRVNASDPKFKQLKVWRDFGSDGIAQPNEIFSLNKLKISSLSVKAKIMRDDRPHIKEPKRFIIAGGAWLLRKGRFNGPDSSEQGLYSIAFQVDKARYKDSTGTVIVKAPSEPNPPKVSETSINISHKKAAQPEVISMLRR